MWFIDKWNILANIVIPSLGTVYLSMRMKENKRKRGLA